VTLTFDLLTPKSIGVFYSKGYHHMKFEGSGSKGTRVIERKRSKTDGQGKNNMSPPEGGRHNYLLSTLGLII